MKNEKYSILFYNNNKNKIQFYNKLLKLKCFIYLPNKMLDISLCDLFEIFFHRFL